MIISNIYGLVLFVMLFVGKNLYSQHADDFLTYTYNEEWIGNENIKLITVKEYYVNNRYKVKMTKRNCILSKFHYDKNGNIVLIERADWKQPFTIDTTDSIINKCSWTGCHQYLYNNANKLKRRYSFQDTVSFFYTENNQLKKIVSKSIHGYENIDYYYYNEFNKIDSALMDHYKYGKLERKTKANYNYYKDSLLKSVFLYEHNPETGDYKLYRKIIYEYNDKGYPSKKDYINLELEEPFIESIELYFYDYYPE